MISCICSFVTASIISVCILVIAPSCGHAQNDQYPVVPDGVKVFSNVVYATRNGDHPLKLDLYVPAGTKPKPLVMWIHGGGWTTGSKDEWVHPLFLVSDGFAVASIDYRLTGEAIYPAQIDDCKSAIRFLRSNALLYGLDPKRFACAGESAGGNLTSLIATTANDSGSADPKDGKVSDGVQAAIDLCGPSDLTTVPDEGPNGSGAYFTAKLLGGPPSQVPDKARAASPVFHITAQTPPIMILHAQGDPICPVAQSEEFYAALQKAGVPSSLTILPVNEHVGAFFWTREFQAKMVAFLDKYLNVTSAPE